MSRCGPRFRPRATSSGQFNSPQCPVVFQLDLLPSAFMKMAHDGPSMNGLDHGICETFVGPVICFVRLYLRHLCRLATPYEKMLMQGIHFGKQSHKVWNMRGPEVEDLAGNAMPFRHGVAARLFLFSSPCAPSHGRTITSD